MRAVVALHKIEQMIDSQRVLEVVAVQVVLLPLEAQPEEPLKTLDIGVDRPFATGDYSLSDDAKQGLANIAKQGLAYSKGWGISVAGFADASGNAAANQVLSKERAQAVAAYLLQECGIPVGRILAPGETNPVASNESPSGLAENRRVEVRLLLNKGVAGGL